MYIKEILSWDSQTFKCKRASGRFVINKSPGTQPRGSASADNNDVKPKFFGVFFEKHCPMELSVTTYCWQTVTFSPGGQTRPRAHTGVLENAKRQPGDGSLAIQPTFEQPIFLGQRMAADLRNSICPALTPMNSTRRNPSYCLLGWDLPSDTIFPWQRGTSVSQTSFQELPLPSRCAILVSHLLTQLHTQGPTL